MKHYFVMVGIALVGCAAAQTFFYGGDTEGEAPYGYPKVALHDEKIYDDVHFSIGSGITGIFGNFLDLTGGTALTGSYEVRSGVGAGNGGTLIASGSGSVQAALTGRTLFGINEWSYTLRFSRVDLPAGTYWIELKLDSPNGQPSWLTVTRGTNGVGGPLDNGNSFFSSVASDYNFAPTNSFGGGSYDFSLGLIGIPAPEPVSLSVLTAGCFVLLRRRQATRR
ncbi:MAG TPA: hypothetical protein VHE55_17295 [Fimbriimonadaceae bacterium]|nr:hypothetical protein [Fimbriimonadaceae bacterium]